MKPIIAIVTLYDEKLESYWMLPGYAQGLEEAGAAPVVLPLTSDPAALERYAHTFDGFLFPGGHDLAPSLYGEEPSEECGTVIPQRDSMEQAFFPLALATRKPLLGICRGIQLFNVMLGGDLYQDKSPPSAPAGWSTTRRPPMTRWPTRGLQVARARGTRPVRRRRAWRRWRCSAPPPRASGGWGPNRGRRRNRKPPKVRAYRSRTAGSLVRGRATCAAPASFRPWAVAGEHPGASPASQSYRATAAMIGFTAGTPCAGFRLACGRPSEASANPVPGGLHFRQARGGVPPLSVRGDCTQAIPGVAT